MNKRISLCVLLSLSLLTGVRAKAADQQKGGQALLNKPVAAHVVADADKPASEAVPSNVFSYHKTGQSHIKSLGQVGRTARYEIVSVKVRGLDTPNVAGFLIYDSTTDSFVGMQTAGAPGLGVALVNGGASVAGNYLFGSKLKPDRTDNSSVSAAVAQNDNDNHTSTANTQGNTTTPPANHGHGNH